jgi:ketosteroid isomerase-like protein
VAAEEEVRAAATALVAAFGAHDTERYFDCFAPSATFVFHSEGDVLTTETYRARWRQWESEGFAVEGCDSLDARVQVVGVDAAVWSHRVRTRIKGVPEVSRERETIVFARTGARWLAVHEHLSIDPGQP